MSILQGVYLFVEAFLLSLHFVFKCLFQSLTCYFKVVFNTQLSRFLIQFLCYLKVLLRAAFFDFAISSVIFNFLVHLHNIWQLLLIKCGGVRLKHLSHLEASQPFEFIVRSSVSALIWCKIANKLATSGPILTKLFQRLKQFPIIILFPNTVAVSEKGRSIIISWWLPAQIFWLGGLLLAIPQCASFKTTFKWAVKFHV